MESVQLTQDKSSKFDKICEQIEYYFSDLNLKRDQYFFDIIQNDPQVFFIKILFMNFAIIELHLDKNHVKL